MQSIQILLYVYIYSTCSLDLQLPSEASYVNLDVIAFKEVYSHAQSVPTENICHWNEHEQAPRQSIRILCSGSFPVNMKLSPKCLTTTDFLWKKKKTQHTPVI